MATENDTKEVDSGNKKIIKYAVYTVLCYILGSILSVAIMAFTVIFIVFYGFGGPTVARNFLILVLAFAIITFTVIFILWYAIKRGSSEDFKNS
jgi:membrane protein implicated in regulation of membrane protease activity